MALVSMKMSKKEAKAEVECSPDDLPAYPWGLSIHLGDDEIKKLGAEGLKAGDEVTVTCKVTVTGCSSNQSLLGESHNSIDLQITDMEIDGEGGSAITKTLYDKK
jgi:hypothetical protein